MHKEQQIAKHEYPYIQFTSEQLKQQFYQAIGELYITNRHRKKQLDDSIYGIEVFVSLAKPESFGNIQIIIDEFFHYPNSYEVCDVIFTPYEMGKYVTSINILTEEDVEKYVDYKSIGELIALNENGVFTEYGYIVYKGKNDKMLEIFKQIKNKYTIS